MPTLTGSLGFQTIDRGKFMNLQTAAKLAALITSLGAGLAQAELVYKYHIAGSQNIVESCRDNNQQPVNTKFVIAVGAISSSPSVLVKIKAKLCTTVADFQKINLNLNLPTDAVNEQALLAMAEGAQKVYSAIPQANDPTQKNDISITRLPKQGTLAPFKIVAKTTGNQVEPFRPIMIFLETNPQRRAAIEALTGGKLMWSNIHYSHKVKVFIQTLTFDLKGELEEVANEQ